MIPLCAQDSPGEECFSAEESTKAIMQASNCGPNNFTANEDCFFLNYIFAYRKEKDSTVEVLKVENSTDKPGGISWVNSDENVGPSGQKGKNFYALCQYVLPTTTTTTTTTSTTTTTTTTTTVAPTTLSQEEMEQHLTKTECPLTGKTGQQTASSPENKTSLPQIDLFLNPERKGELDELRRWVEKNEENLTFTEVGNSSVLFPPGCSVSNLPQPLPTALALHATLLPLQRQPRVTPHAQPVLLARD